MTPLSQPLTSTVSKDILLLNGRSALPVLWIALFFSSCFSLSNQYQDQLGADKSFWLTYNNTDLEFQLNYNSDYKLHLHAENWKKVQLPKSFKKMIKPSLKKGGELLYWGTAKVSPYFYTTAIVYPNKLSNTDKEIPTSLFEKTKIQVDEQDAFRYTYQVDELKFVDYFVTIKEHFLRVTFLINNESGYREDDFVFMKKEALLLHEASSLFENWYATYKAAIIPSPPSSPFSLAAESFDTATANYLAPIIALEQQEQFYDSIGFFDFYCQAIGTYQSFVGNTEKATYYFDKRFDKFIKPFKDTLNTESFKTYSIQSAKDYLLKRSQSEQVLMFNEAHHIAAHRTFLAQLLPDLYKNGFRYLALEALDSECATLREKGYPTIDCGFYTKEPEFAKLLRLAFSLGFDIIPYENTEDCENNTTDKYYCQTKRDSNQAVNISRILKKDVDAKIIVLAGYQHIEEASRTKWVTMAQHFKKITGINPFTIDQTQMNAKSGAKFEHPYYRGLIDYFPIDVPSIVLNEERIPWINSKSDKYYDSQIIHPRRPNYTEKIQLNELSCNLESNEFPIILQVFLTREWAEERFQAIPVFNSILQSKEVLSEPPKLSKGNTIIIRDKDGVILCEKEVNY